MPKLTYENLIEQFLLTVPELECLYQHEIETLGEVHHYQFFGIGLVKMMRQLYVSSLNRPTSPFNDILERIVDFIEVGAASNEERVVDVIRNGLIESMYASGRDYPAITALLRTKSRELLKLIEDDFGVPAEDDSEVEELFEYVNQCIDKLSLKSTNE